MQFITNDPVVWAKRLYKLFWSALILNFFIHVFGLYLLPRAFLLSLSSFYPFHDAARLLSVAPAGSSYFIYIEFLFVLFVLVLLSDVFLVFALTEIIWERLPRKQERAKRFAHLGWKLIAMMVCLIAFLHFFSFFAPFPLYGARDLRLGAGVPGVLFGFLSFMWLLPITAGFLLALVPNRIPDPT